MERELYSNNNNNNNRKSSIISSSSSSSSSEDVRNFEEFDAIVVGGGIMGSCTAYQLAKRGQKTLLLEQFDFLHQRGSSHGESRTIRATYPEDYYSALVTEAARLWEEAQSEIGFKVYFKTQHLDMGPTDCRSLLSVISSCQKNGIPHQVLQPHQLADRFSGRISIPEDWIGVTTETGGIIKPTKAVSMFQTLALGMGAVLMDNMEVKSIVKDEEGSRGGIWVSAANGQRFWGKKCVVTAGAWSSKLLTTVAKTGGPSGLEHGPFQLPIQALETGVCYWRIKKGHEDDFGIEGGFPTFASYGMPYVYGTPSLEYPGLIKISVHGGYPCDPDRRPWGPGIPMQHIKEWIQGRFQGLIDCDGPVATQLCIYAMTPDEDFVIDFLGENFGKDVVVGAGFSGHGFKMAPVVGRILADLVIHGEEAPGVDLHRFRIRRFQENPKGNVKDFEDQVNSFTNTRSRI